ncbi:MAG: transglutaminase domain-containing protein [Deltaproteobacteria bacterium]|nr:transglutaminase domain-containing protein [Deltaproteobacteria bacterium]
MVALSDVAPKLLLSTSPDWYAKSTWFFKVNEDFGSFESTPEIKAKVDEILKQAKTETDSISLLTHWCADEIRYSGISMGEGEGFTLHKGGMTFTDRCGVCKDKAGMLITMLRAAGFESYPAMTMAGSRIDYIPADQFNHCVTIVKLSDGQYHLLDPTWVPFLRELWSSAEQQQQYLMGVPEGADLATTPLSPPENHYIKVTSNAELLANGTLTGTMVITAEGQSDGSVRGYFKNSSKTEWNRNIEREFLRIHPRVTITKLEYGDPMDYLAGPIRIEIGYAIPDYAIVSGSTLFFKPLMAAQLFRSAQSHLYFDTDLDTREFAFRDRCSRQVNVLENIRIPALKQAVRIPEPVDEEGTVASIYGGYTLQGEILSFQEKITLGKRIYEPGEWPQYRAVVAAQNRFAKENVVIELISE